MSDTVPSTGNKDEDSASDIDDPLAPERYHCISKVGRNSPSCTQRIVPPAQLEPAKEGPVVIENKNLK